MSAMIRELNESCEEGQIFKCSLHTNGLELENELRLFRSSQVVE